MKYVTVSIHSSIIHSEILTYIPNVIHWEKENWWRFIKNDLSLMLGMSYNSGLKEFLSVEEAVVDKCCAGSLSNILELSK